MTELDRLIRDLAHGAVGWELLALVACIAAAWGIAWLLGRSRNEESVWFGRAIVDGLLFPLLALVLVYSARGVMGKFQAVPLLRIAVPVLISLAGIRFLARVFTIVFPRSPLARLVERLFSWLAWIAAVLWIVGLLPDVMAEMDNIEFAFGKSKVTLLALVQGVLSAGAVLVLTLWISAAIERNVLREAVHDLSLRKVANNSIRVVLVIVGLLFALSAVGVDLTALSVLGGAVGVGLGFGLQKLAANYMSGFVILWERSLRIGDTVRVDNFEGVVADIKTRYTLIRSLTGRESIVPNEKLITERIENLSLADPRVLVQTEVTVGYDSDVDAVQRILVESAAGTPRVIAEPAPSPRLARFGPDGLEWVLYFWIEDPANGQMNVKSDVNLRILKGLREAGIEIPYPQRVVEVRHAREARPLNPASADTSSAPPPTPRP
ncbi:MAG TPA: mechanosensitive ion channel domain-containing protein [Ramlibacter sp.]|uniref:mechanosensitive ion channel family protein n=1 Tax=Ramlibacter sp. TaxID=1917967 RepID=UPI002C7A187A|nr:mechanosensitive ion channel domain-containing protein [Ramlibacter sp.]HVZ45869.1 mechanosensitive ion channel domain-containing protein [Ramlibacter sp.]